MLENQSFFKEFFTAFIPIFVAIDPIGVIPVFLSLTDGIDKVLKKKLVYQATLTAFIISILFLFSGRWLFNFLGITESDFRIAGGIVLLILSIMDLLFSTEHDRRLTDTSLGIVPLGIPLIMGPAALTTILISVQHHGFSITGLALIANLLLVLVCFLSSDLILKVIGRGGAKAFAKVTALFVAAIAVMMIRVGITDLIKK